jgi:heat shock protein HtpX
MRFAPDRGLSLRMLSTMLLLGLVYVLFVALLLAAGVALIPVLIVAGLLLGAQFWFSDRIALFSMQARIVSPEEAPQLHGLVDRLCALADMPKPQVAIASTDLPNAFATGRSQKAAVLCVTTGLMRRLDPGELEGVIAHELSHVAHRDVAVITIASFLGMLAGFLARMAMYAGLFGDFGEGNGRRGGGGGNTMAAGLVVMAISGLVYLVSFLLIRALSRYRELLADRAGAQLTGRPSALASALVKVSGDMGRIPTRDLRQAEHLNAFFFSPVAARGFSLSSLFATHPSLERRLAQLQALEAQMDRPS